MFILSHAPSLHDGRTLSVISLTEEQLVLEVGDGVTDERRETGADVLDVEVEADCGTGESGDRLLILGVRFSGGNPGALEVHSLYGTILTAATTLF